MLTKRNYLTPNDTFILFPIVLFVFLIVQITCLSVGEAMNMLLPMPTNLTDQLTIVLGTASIGLAVIVYALVRRINLIDIARVNQPPKLSHIGCIFIVLLGVLAIGVPLSQMFIQWLNVDTQGMTIPVGESLSIRDIFFLLIGVCLLPALCEELFMRGIIAIGLCRYGKIKASIICGILFMLFHMNPLQTVHQAFFGFILAYIMLSGGNLWVCIIMHFANNLSSLLLSVFMPLRMQMTLFIDFWYLSVIVGIVLVIVGLLLYKHVVGKDAYDKDSEYRLLNSQSYTATSTVDPYNQAVTAQIDDKPITEVKQLEKPKIVTIACFALGVVICVGMWVATFFTL